MVERKRIYDLTPPHRNRTTGVHGIGSESISEARDEQETLNFLTGRVIRSILFALWPLDWENTDLWDIDWEEWLDPVLRSGEASETFDWNNQNLTGIGGIQLQTVVYDDMQFHVSSGKVPAANYPTWETFTTNTKAYAFSVDDYIDLETNELPHWWKEGTAGHVHVHFTIKTAQSTGANRFAQFSVWIAYADTDEAWVEQTVLTEEYTIPTGSAALTNFYLDMGEITLTNYLIGSQIKTRIKRIAATGGTEYADDVYITQVGIHFQRDAIGSREELTK